MVCPSTSQQLLLLPGHLALRSLYLSLQPWVYLVGKTRSLFTFAVPPSCVSLRDAMVCTVAYSIIDNSSSTGTRTPEICALNSISVMVLRVFWGISNLHFGSDLFFSLRLLLLLFVDTYSRAFPIYQRDLSIPIQWRCFHHFAVQPPPSHTRMW